MPPDNTYGGSRRRRASAYRSQMSLGASARARRPTRRAGHGGPTGPGGPVKRLLREHWKRLLAVALLGFVVIAGGTLTYILWTLRDLPDPGQKPAFASAITIYDRSGQQIAQIKQSNGYFQELSFKDMGQWNPAAMVGAEDRNYYHHGAIDYLAVLRAMGRNVLSRDYVEGGSTITQEVVNISVNNSAHQRSLFWKMQEAVLATGLEQKYSKQDILAMYLNRVFYGHNAYGIGAAAQVFFSKPASQLTLGQAAFLAGLPRGPAYYDPQLHYDNAKARQVYVLGQMVQNGSITQAQADAAAKEDIKPELTFQPINTTNIAPHFVNWIQSQLESKLTPAIVQQGDLKVYTTLDLGLQQQAVNAVTSGVQRLAREGVNNGALLAANPVTGEILAWVGSADYNNVSIDGQYDVVSGQGRQPGSSYKPYVYEAALKDQKITLASTGSFVSDTPYDYPDSTQPVVDWDNSYEGNIPVRKALVGSRNVPAVKIGQIEGMDNVNNLARQMGVTGNLLNVPSAAIGTSQINILSNVQGYQVFADQGKKMPLYGITKVVQGDSNLLYGTIQPGTQEGQGQPLTAAQAYLITDVLKDYPAYWGLGWSTQMAGKSGTTGGANMNEHPDAWMMAYNPKIVIGTWAANTTHSTTQQFTSAFGTDVGSTITRLFINSLPATYQGWYSGTPAGLVRGGGCPGYRTNELFLDGTQNGVNCGQSPPPTPTPTATPEPTVQPTQTPEPTPVPTPTPIVVPSIFPTQAPRQTPSPQATAG